MVIQDTISKLQRKPYLSFSGLDAMGLSVYKDEARAANEGAIVELKGRRMLSASHRFKKQDSEQLQKLMEEQERIFELVSNLNWISTYWSVFWALW